MDKTMIPLVLAFLLPMVSCVKRAKDPEEALRNYINYRFSKNQTKNKLLKKTTGELHNQLKGLSEAELNQLVNPIKYQRGSLDINLKKCSETICHITYTFKFKQKNSKQKPAFKAVTRKIAQIELVEEKTWKIAKISEIKTYFEAKEPLDVVTPGKTQNPFQ